MPTTTLPQYTVTAVNMGYMRVDHSEMVYGRGFGNPVDIRPGSLPSRGQGFGSWWTPALLTRRGFRRDGAMLAGSR